MSYNTLMDTKTTKNRRTLEEIKTEIGPIAVFVRSERKQLGYTQQEFATRVGIGLRFLKDLELGKKSVRLDKVNQVLNYFGAEASPVPLRQAASKDE